MARTQYDIPKNKRKSVIEDALEVSFLTETDELDCNKSFSRYSSNKTPQEVLELCLSKSAHFVFILKDEREQFGEKDYFDVGCSTLTASPDYFLFISLSIEDGNKLIKKHDLKKMNYER